MDPSVSELPISEQISGKPWFWNVCLALASIFPDDWLHDVQKAMISHANIEDLLEWVPLSPQSTHAEKELEFTVLLVRARESRDFAYVQKYLVERASAEPESIWANEYLDALEVLQSPLIAEWMASHISATPRKLFPRLKRAFNDLQLVDADGYHSILWRLICKIGADDPGLAVQLWEEMQRNFPAEVEERLDEAKFLLRIHRENSLPENREKIPAKWIEGLDGFLNSAVPDASDAPEVKKAREIAKWVIDGSCNKALNDLRFGTYNTLTGEPCRLTQLRVLDHAIEHTHESKAKYLKDMGSTSERWCAIHESDAQEILRFLNQNLTVRDSTVILTRMATHRFLSIAKNAKPFALSSRGERFLTHNSNAPLLPWQENALTSWAAHGRQGIVAAATGTGKSRLGVAAVIEAYEDGIPIVLLTHRLAIKGQWRKDELYSTAESDVDGNSIPEELRIFRLGENVIELSCEDHYLVSDPPAAVPGKVLLALDKSLAARPWLMPTIGSPGLLVADEVHSFGSESGLTVLEGNFDRRLGLSATIGNGDSSVMEKFGKSHVTDYPISRAIKDQIISEYNLLVIRVPLLWRMNYFGEVHQLELNRKIDVEFTQEDLDKAALELDLLRKPLEEGLQLDEGEDFVHGLDRIIRNRHPKFSKPARKYLNARSNYDRIARSANTRESVLDILAPKVEEYGKTLVFSNTRSQGKEFRDELEAKGVNVRYIDGDTEQFGRSDAFKSLNKDLTRAVIAPMILDEGINIPNARIGVFLGPGTRGYRQTVQRMGRVLRKNREGERSLLILATGINTREDPGADGKSNRIDSTYAVMVKHASNTRIVGFDDPSEVRSSLDELLDSD